jgi:hypothetical protein
MDARYGDETSNLRISRVTGEFLVKHLRNTLKRIFYNFFLRDLSIASLELVAGCVLIVAGGLYGAAAWVHSAHTGQPTAPGTVMLAALPLIIGLQFVLAFLNYDIATVPRRPIHRIGKAPPPP